MAALELRGEDAELVERSRVIALRPAAAQATLHRRSVALGQVVEHVSLLVADAALDRHLAEHGADRLAQRLRAVEHAEHALLDIKAALDEVGQQRGRDGDVLGRPLPEPERDLHPVGRDPERHHVGAALELDPVEHQHRQADVVEAAGDQLRERLARALLERARDRRLRCRPRRLLDLLADRFLRALVAARRNAGEHPLEHDRGQGVAVGEVAVGGELHFLAGVALRARGRSIATRRPPSVTSPAS